MASLQETYIDLRERLKQLSSTDKLLLALAREVYILTNKRIFTDGKLVDGSKITYKHNKILAGRSSFPNQSGYNKFAGSKKKREELNWVTLKNGATLFEVTGGFIEIKKASGRPNPFDFTGQLKKSYTYSSGKGQALIGFAEVKRLTTDGKPTETTNKDVIEGLTDTKGQIFGMAAEEEQKVDEIINAYLESILNGKQAA